MEVAQIWWWGEGAVEACCRAEVQGLIPSRLASFQPSGMSVLLQSKAWGSRPPHHHHNSLRMIDALSAPYSRERALDICIIEWGWEKRGGKRDGEQGDRLRGCVFAFERVIGHRVCVVVASAVCVYIKETGVILEGEKLKWVTEW